MGLFDRLRGRTSASLLPLVESLVEAPPAAARPEPEPWVVLGGDDDLELVGEASYQNALWAICQGAVGDRIRHRIVGVLVLEPTNPYDPNAIRVDIQGMTIGYMSAGDAPRYRPGLQALTVQHGCAIALRGVIVGGGYYPDGPGRLGVWLDHDPTHFGLPPVGQRSTWIADRPVQGTMRTGFTEAWLTDAEDDSYDLSWFKDLPNGDRESIVMLRRLLDSDPDPIDRHFQFTELESRIYRCRDLYSEALDEFDEACRRHDAEMESICAAFRQKWSKVPLLETYKQMAIRQQKLKDWPACVWWTERGLDLYANDAAREDAVEDLLKRRNRALGKLEEANRPGSPKAPRVASSPSAIEVLVCSSCGGSFERTRTRGRKPSSCPSCREGGSPSSV